MKRMAKISNPRGGSIYKTVYFDDHGSLLKYYILGFLEEHPRLKRVVDEENNSIGMTIRSWKSFCREYQLDYSIL